MALLNKEATPSEFPEFDDIPIPDGEDDGAPPAWLEDT